MSIKLIAKRTKFYSADDKEMFFERLNAIKVIDRFEGVGDELHMYIDKIVLNDYQLCAIFSLFRRYKIDMKQLDIFLNKNNEELFRSCKNGYSICVYPRS